MYCLHLIHPCKLAGSTTSSYIDEDVESMAGSMMTHPGAIVACCLLVAWDLDGAGELLLLGT